MPDPYRIVTVTLRAIRPQSIFVDRPRASGEVSIPRSLIHGADDRALSERFSGEKFEIRIMGWKAEELGLA